MVEILSALEHRDRQALFQFYVDGHEEHQIEVNLDLNSGHLQELRRSVRAAFSKRRVSRIGVGKTIANA